MDDNQFQRRLRQLAEEAAPRPGSAEDVLRRGRVRRRLVTGAAVLSLVALLGGVAGAITLLDGSRRIDPAPRPEQTTGCIQPAYDVAMFVPMDATEEEIENLASALEADDRVASIEFLRAEEAADEFRRENPDHEGRLPTGASDAQFRLQLVDEVDPHRVGKHFADLGGAGALAPAADCPAPEPATKFARYFFEVAEGSTSASGTLEVDWEAKSVCFDADLDGKVVASHLLMEQRPSPGTQSDRVFPGTVLTFFAPEDDVENNDATDGRTHCLRGEDLGQLESELHLLLDRHELFRIDFHRGPDDEPGLVAELKESPDDEESSDYYVDEARNFALRLPQGWDIARRSLTPNLDDPREILSVGTAPMRAGERCQQPVRALQALGPQDAFISIKERRDDAGYPSRPRSFKEELEHRVFNIDLCTPVDDFRPYLLTFSDAGRHFYLLAALGTEASAERTREFWEVLDSLDFSPEAASHRVRAFMQATCASDEITDTDKEPNYSADYLHRWQTADGCDVRLDILMMRQGDEACGGPKVADILMTWPLGSSETAPEDEHRIFVKDPTGVFGDDRTTELYQEDATLPDDARDTGFRLGDTQLWMVPGDDTFIYLVDDDATERWPLDESPDGCA